MLLVTFVDNPFNRLKYKQLLQKITAVNFHNIELLEIACIHKRPSQRVKYRMIKFDVFKKILKISKYSREANFFSSTMKNLHGLRLKMLPLKFKTSYGKNTLSNQIYDLPIHMATNHLNGTLLTTFNDKAQDCFFLLDTQNLTPLRDRASLYPAKTFVVYYMVPAMYDKVESWNYSRLLINSLMIFSIIFAFKLLSYCSDLDSLTWGLAVTFSMIIGVGNPRYPVRFGETIAFMTLTAVGFFFGSDLIFGLFSVNIVEEVERAMDTASDVVQNNISFVFLFPAEKEATKDLPNIKWTKQAEMHQDMLLNMFLHKNEFVPWYLELLGLPCPDRIVISGKVHARKSKIRHAYNGKFTWHLPRNCPWQHHLNCNLLRFYDSHLDFVYKKNLRGWHIAANIYKNSFNRLTLKVMEESEAELEELDYLWLIILFSVVLSLVALAFEVLLDRHHKTIQNLKVRFWAFERLIKQFK